MSELTSKQIKLVVEKNKNKAYKLTMIFDTNIVINIRSFRGCLWGTSFGGICYDRGNSFDGFKSLATRWAPQSWVGW
jgi:hypothetical protein